MNCPPPVFFKPRLFKMLKLFSPTVSSDMKYLVCTHNNEVSVVDDFTDLQKLNMLKMLCSVNIAWFRELVMIYCE